MYMWNMKIVINGFQDKAETILSFKVIMTLAFGLVTPKPIWVTY